MQEQWVAEREVLEQKEVGRKSHLVSVLLRVFRVISGVLGTRSFLLGSPDDMKSVLRRAGMSGGI